MGGEVSPARVRGVSLVGQAAPNVLTGKIPAELGDLGSMRALELQLAGNALSGCIPQSLRAPEESELDETGLQFCS